MRWIDDRIQWGLSLSNKLSQGLRPHGASSPFFVTQTEIRKGLEKRPMRIPEWLQFRFAATAPFKNFYSGIACQRPTSKAGDSTKRSCAPLVTLQKSNICSQLDRLPDLKRVKTSRHMKAASSSFDLSDPPQVRESMTSKDVPPSPRRYVLWGFKRLSTGCRRTSHCRG